MKVCCSHLGDYLGRILDVHQLANGVSYGSHRSVSKCVPRTRHVTRSSKQSLLEVAGVCCLLLKPRQVRVLQRS
jgi:hypothetical protein